MARPASSASSATSSDGEPSISAGRRTRRTTSSQRPCARSTSSISSRTAPRPPPRALTQSHARAHLRRRVGRRRRQPARAQHRQVEQVVAHVGDRRRRSSPASRRICSYAVELARHALHDDADRRAAPRDAPSRPTTAPTAGRPAARRAAPRRSPRRRGCGSPWIPAVGVHQDDAVGQHAVDVEEQQRAPRAAFGPAPTSPLRTSACARDRAGARRLRRARRRRRRRPR